MIVTQQQVQVYNAVNNMGYKLSIALNFAFWIGISIVWFYFAFAVGFAFWWWLLWGIFYLFIMSTAIFRFPRYYEIHPNRLDVQCVVYRYSYPLMAIREAICTTGFCSNYSYGRSFVSDFGWNTQVRIFF